MDEQETYKHLPYDIEVEQALLGAAIVDNAVMDRFDYLQPLHFYDPLHQRLFEAMQQMHAKGSLMTVLTLHAMMKSDPGLVEVGGHAYLAGLVQAAPALPNVRGLANILRDLHTRRALIDMATDIANKAVEPPLDITSSRMIEDAEKELYKIGAASTGAQAINTSFAAALTESVRYAEKAIARGGRISGVETGFTDIDGLLGGLQQSDLIIVAGRPGMGKTALATNMAFNAARLRRIDTTDGIVAEECRGAAVLYFSLEMAARQLSDRILSEQTGIEGWKIRNGRLDDEEWERFVLTMQDLADLPLDIDDTAGISVAQIATRSRRAARQKKIGAIIIDHIQLVAGTGRTENRTQELTEISKGLKVLAKELNVPVVALSQLSRAVDAREDKRPVMSDLRESGSIEQDADVVMFVYREEYYLQTREPDPAAPEYAKWLEKCQRAFGKAEILVEKHRHGATRKIDLQFDHQFTRFSNLSTEQRS